MWLGGVCCLVFAVLVIWLKVVGDYLGLGVFVKFWFSNGVIDSYSVNEICIIKNEARFDDMQFELCG